MASPTAPAADPAWLKNARELVGLKEIVGSRHEAKILQFFAEAGHPEIHDDETAWCAAFANAMLRRAGYAGTGALNARSFLNWGTKLDAPKPGCIVVFKRGNSEWQGHVAFFLRDLGNGYLEVLGGNQGNAVSIAPHRKGDVLGYRWPLIKGVTKVLPVAVPVPVKPSVKAEGAKVAGAAAATTGIVVSARAAADAGVSTLEILAWIGGLSAVGIAAIIIGYRYFKGAWPWTGSQSQESSLPSLPQSAPSLEDLSQAQLALASAGSQARLSPMSSASSQPLKPSAKPSRKTRTPARKSSSSKSTAAKKSAPKRTSKSKR